MAPGTAVDVRSGLGAELCPLKGKRQTFRSFGEGIVSVKVEFHRVGGASVNVGEQSHRNCLWSATRLVN